MTDRIPSRPLLHVAATVGRTLQPAHAERLGAALAAARDPDEAQPVVGLVPTPAFRHAAQQLLTAWRECPDVPGVAVGSTVAAAAHAHHEARRHAHAELVVSGPTSTVIHARRTEQVVLQLVHEAQHDILLVTFALQMHDELRTALKSASQRGVAITILAEDPADSHGFLGDPAAAMTGIAAHRLRWPAEQRPAAGAALHAKTVVTDSSTAFITSANLTKRAAGDNLEVGVLIHGGDIPLRLVNHMDQLRQRSIVTRA